MSRVSGIIIEIIREISFLIWTILRDRHEQSKKKTTNWFDGEYDSSNNLTGVTFKLYYTPPIAPTTPAGLDPDPFTTALSFCPSNPALMSMTTAPTVNRCGFPLCTT